MSKPIKFKLPNGDVIFTYPIRELASRMNRKSEDLRGMERRGALPETPFKVKDRRYYSDEQMNLICQCARECNIRNGVSFEKSGFVDKIYRRHNSLMKRYGINLS
jgi:hypothetical protein